MKKWKNMTAFFLALALTVNMLFAGNIVVKAEETTDTEAPVITFFAKNTEDPIYTGDAIPFLVSYSDASTVESIEVTFEGEDKSLLYGEMLDKAQEDETEQDLGNEQTKKELDLVFYSSCRTLTGTFTLVSIRITDKWGNSRYYSDKDKNGTQISFYDPDQDLEAYTEAASVLAEDEPETTTWDTWKKTSTFKRVLYNNGLRVTNVTLDSGLNANAVEPGTKFNANITLKNDSTKDYTVTYSQIIWSGSLTDDGYSTEINVDQEKEFTIAHGKSSVISIPVQLEKNEIEGKRTLCSIYISDYQTEIYCEMFEDGTFYSFYGDNLTGSFKPNADFTIKKPATPPAPPAPTPPALTSTPTTNTQPAAPSEVINRKLKGTKIISLKAAKKKVVVKWKKQTKKIKGYQLQYSTDKKFKTDVKTKTITGKQKTSVTLKKLKSKKTYYVRIRTWQKTSTGKAYSLWSKAKKVKVK